MMKKFRTTPFDWIWKIRASRLFICFLFALLAFGLKAQVQVQWSNNLGGDRNDWIRSAIALDNQQTLLVGASYSGNGDLSINQGRADAWLVKVDDAGQLLWSQSYGGSGQDELVDIKATSDGGFILVGTSNSTDGDVLASAGGTDVWLLKVDANGQMEWSTTFGGSGDDRANEVLVRSNGQYWIIANADSGDLPGVGQHNESDAWLLRVDTDGTLLWSRTYGAEGTDWIHSALLLSDGNLLLAGHSDSSPNWMGNPKGAADAWLLRVASNGQVIWSQKYGGTNADFFKALTPSANGTYTLSGYTYSEDGDLLENRGRRDAWAMQVDGSGNSIWSKNFGGTFHDEFLDIQYKNNALYLAGYSWSADGDITQAYGLKDFSLFKISNTGESIWQRNFGGSQSDEARGIILLENEKSLLYGASRSEDQMLNNNRGLEDAWLLQLVETNGNFSVDLGLDQQICAGESLQFDVNNAACLSCNYQWNDGFNGAFRNLQPNTSTTYSVTLTDVNGSSTSDAIFIEVLPITTILQIDDASPTCFDEADGNIQIETPTGNYDAIWNNGATGLSLEQIPAGTYMVTITELGSCPIVETINLIEPPAISADVSVSPSGCGVPNGAINLTPSGGTPPYSYLWSNSSTQQDQNGLAQGNYQVSINDGNDCQLIVQLAVPSTSDFDINFEVQPVTCHGAADGAINLDLGGVDPLVYVWSNGALTPNISALSGGNYTVTIALANGCSGIQNIEVPEPDPIVVDYASGMPTCFGLQNGFINLMVSGGIGPYQYQWSNGANNPNISVGAGQFTVSIEDENACIETTAISIDAPPLIQIDAMVSQVTCSGEADGAIDLIVSGGTGDLQYSWNTGQEVEDLVNISGGIYSVLISDENGCASTRSFQIFESLPIGLNITADSPTIGSSDGSLLIAPSGGVPAYSVSWSNGGTSFFNNNLSTGFYQVTVEDASYCSIIQIIELENAVATEELSLVDHFECYPNPSQGRFVLDLLWKEQREFSVALYNALGQKLSQTQYRQQRLQQQFNCEEWSAGLYFIQIESEDTSFTKRLIFVDP